MKKLNHVVILIIILILSTSCPAQNTYRDKRMQPQRIMDSLRVKEGAIIGEAGAGKGYFTFWLSKRVGDTGKIYANDIKKHVLEKIETRCEKEAITNIETVVGEVTDPMFPVDSLDLIVMMIAFHDFTKPVKWLKKTKKYMRANGQLVIIDRDPDRWGQGHDHFMTQKEVLKLTKKAGFERVNVFTFLERDNIYVFQIKNLFNN
jgi:ubiquinone/menaquinone biosynthesis C-methylase UbiE